MILRSIYRFHLKHSVCTSKIKQDNSRNYLTLLILEISTAFKKNLARAIKPPLHFNYGRPPKIIVLLLGLLQKLPPFLTKFPYFENAHPNQSLIDKKNK